MDVFKPDEFKISDEENDLNSRFPSIHTRRSVNNPKVYYIPHNNYFASQNGFYENTDRSNRSGRGGIPLPKSSKNKGNKTARASTPSELPNINNRRYTRPTSKHEKKTHGSLKNRKEPKT